MAKPFVREATGLVKAASAFDVFMYNQAGMAIVGNGISFAVLGFIYLGGDLFTMWWVSLVLTVLLMLTYYLLSVAMPRAGADYVYHSRLLHPALGFIAAGFTGWLAALINIGFVATAWVTAGLGPLLSYASFATNNPTLSNLAVTVVSPGVAFVLASVTVLSFALVLGMGGTRAFLRIQNVLMIAVFVILAIMILVAVTTPRAHFVDSFNSITRPYNTSYTDVMTKASGAGWTLPPSTPLQALFVVPLVFSYTWWASQSGAISGEVRNVKKSQLIGMIGAPLLGMTVFFVAYSTLIGMVGYDFATAMGYLGLNSPSTITVPVLLPFPAIFYYGLATNNLLLTTIIALMPMIALIPMTGWGLLIFSRYLFAMSFDRVLPQAFSNVSERFHTPIYSISIAAILAIALMASLQFISGLYPTASSFVYYMGVSANVLLQVVAFISALALALFPYLRKSLYEQVFPFKRKIAGIPIATWSGVITMGILVYTLDIWFLQPFSQLVYGGFPQLAYLCVGWAVILLVMYGTITAYRRRRGMDISLVFKELPPE